MARKFLFNVVSAVLLSHLDLKLATAFLPASGLPAGNRYDSGRSLQLNNHHHGNSNGDLGSVVLNSVENVDFKDKPQNAQRPMTRRNASIRASQAIASILAGTTAMSAFPVSPSFADEETFESIAAKASALAKQQESSTTPEAAAPKSDGKTAYDFTVPVAGKQTSIGELIGAKPNSEDNPVKAFLVVNIKQDDPIARQMIPELITLGSRYGGKGEFGIICVPTDQGYYEPDTSALIRLKLASEYGYGINPAMKLTDKMNLMGTGAHPFMRWIQTTCRTPSGLGRVQGNFEKFLVDGQTGMPVRRYPRKYVPYDIADDIETLLKGEPLQPPIANFQEKWRTATYEAERDTYRFQKGINVFDQ